MIRFDYTSHGAIISSLQPLIGQSGWLELGHLTIDSFGTEEFLVITARVDDSEWLDSETAAKLMRLPMAMTDKVVPPTPDLSDGREQLIEQHVREVDARE